MRALRRIWVEHLPPSEMGHPSTRRLLLRFGLSPLIAIPPKRQTTAMHRALDQLGADGVPIGLWPLLTDEAGYWPSVHNLSSFVRRTWAVLEFGGGVRGGVKTMAIDLEPPVDVMRALMDGPRLGPMIRRFRWADPDRQERFLRAERELSSLLRELGNRNIESLGAILPPLVFDLVADRQVWQRVFQTPIDHRSFDVVSPMLYTSVLKTIMPVGGHAGARACLYDLTRRLVSLRGGLGCCISVGLVGTGKLEREPTLLDPDELRADVRCAIAGGARDLALFSLEGVLKQSHPERWLEAFTGAAADPRPPPQARRWKVAVGLGAWLTRRWPGSV